MTINLNYDRAVAAVRSEIAKFYDLPFGDFDDFNHELDIASDDLSAIALSLEKNLGVKLSPDKYRAIRNVRSWALALCSAQ